MLNIGDVLFLSSDLTIAILGPSLEKFIYKKGPYIFFMNLILYFYKMIYIIKKNMYLYIINAVR